MYGCVCSARKGSSSTTVHDTFAACTSILILRLTADSTPSVTYRSAIESLQDCECTFVTAGSVTIELWPGHTQYGLLEIAGFINRPFMFVLPSFLLIVH